MSRRFSKKIGSSFLVVALAAILVSGGIAAACSKAQTTTSAPAQTTTSTPARTTTSGPAQTTTTAPPQTTTSAPTPTGVSAADFYKANVVTIVVPYGAGGGVDYAARLVANYWNEVTGGRMIVENKEGASGLLGANFVYAAKPDGLTMGAAIPGSGLIPPVLGHDPAVKFDLRKFSWIQAFDTGDNTGLAISAKLPYESMQDLAKAKGLKFAAAGGITRLAPGVVIEFFGLQDARIVPGYSGTNEAYLAVGKGEVDAYVTGNANALDAMAKGFVKKPLLTLVARDKYFPDVPSIPELLKLSPAQEALLKTAEALAGGNAFWCSSDVPQDRIEFMRTAFAKIMAMDGFLKQAALRWKYFDAVSGKDYAAEMEKTLAAATPEKYDELQKLADKYIR